MNKAHSGLYALAEIYYTPCKLLVKTAWVDYTGGSPDLSIAVPTEVTEGFKTLRLP
jgi:hypothetical protein